MAGHTVHTVEFERRLLRPAALLGERTARMEPAARRRIDRAGHVREEFEDDPGPGTVSTKASFAVLLANAARQYLGRS